MKNKLKVEIYHKASYVGDDSSEFEPLKIYRGEWLVFQWGILMRHRTKFYQSGLGNWEFLG